jgi:outer membrane protein TolC
VAAISRLFAQSPPVSSSRPWHSSEEQQTIRDVQRFHPPTVRIEPGKIYSLAELIDLAETHNPETRVAWQNARAQAASIGIARSELFPTLSAVALAGIDRQEASLGSQFYRQTIPNFQISLNLNYTIFSTSERGTA